MSLQDPSAPNPRVRELYDRLGALLDRGDEAFVEAGPELLAAAIDDQAFFEGVETDHAPPGDYTRAKVVGDPGAHVVRYMEWPPGYTLLPHEHHGRPCFEVLVDGFLSVVQMDPVERPDGRYEMTVLDTETCRPGDSSVVDPRENEVHAVYSPVRSRSLHVYPEDNASAYGYVLDEDADADADADVDVDVDVDADVDVDVDVDVYRRERFELDCEA